MLWDALFRCCCVCKLLGIGFSLCCYLVQICAFQYLSPLSFSWVLYCILFLSVFFPVSLFGVTASCSLSFLLSFHLDYFSFCLETYMQLDRSFPKAKFASSNQFLLVFESQTPITFWSRTMKMASVWSAMKDYLFVWEHYKKIPQLLLSLISVMKSTPHRCFIFLGVKHSSIWMASIQLVFLIRFGGILLKADSCLIQVMSFLSPEACI